jgi:filamentous hemagglutinin
LEEDQILYRVYGGGANETGRKGTFLTPVEPTGVFKSRIDSALLPEWGNTAEQVAVFRIPKGTVIYEGFSSSHGGIWVGGKTQIYIRDVKSEWIIWRRRAGP